MQVEKVGLESLSICEVINYKTASACLRSKLTGIAWFFRHWSNHKLCLHLSKKTVKASHEIIGVNKFLWNCMWYVDWQSDEREVMFHSMLFWKAKCCGNAIRREDSDVPNPLSQSSSTDYQGVVTNMGRKYTEIDHGKCKLIYPRESWCLVTARNCLPNRESEGRGWWEIPN